MKNVKIGAKLIMSFLFLAALTAFMGIYAIKSLREVSDATNVMYDKGAVPLGIFVATANQVQELRIQALYWRLAKSQAKRDEILKKMDNLNNDINHTVGEQIKTVITEAGIANLKKVMDLTDKYIAEVRSLQKPQNL